MVLGNFLKRIGNCNTREKEIDQFWQEKNFVEKEIDQVFTDYYDAKEFDQVLITKTWERNISEKEIDQVLTGVYLVAAALLNKPLPLL